MSVNLLEIRLVVKAAVKYNLDYYVVSVIEAWLVDELIKRTQFVG